MLLINPHSPELKFLQMAASMMSISAKPENKKVKAEPHEKTIDIPSKISLRICKIKTQARDSKNRRLMDAVGLAPPIRQHDLPKKKSYLFEMDVNIK